MTNHTNLTWLRTSRIVYTIKQISAYTPQMLRAFSARLPAFHYDGYDVFPIVIISLTNSLYVPTSLLLTKRLPSDSQLASTCCVTSHMLHPYSHLSIIFFHFSYHFLRVLRISFTTFTNVIKIPGPLFSLRLHFLPSPWHLEGLIIYHLALLHFVALFFSPLRPAPLTTLHLLYIQYRLVYSFALRGSLSKTNLIL